VTPLFDSRGLGTTVVVVELLAVLALAFAAIGYVDSSSEAAFAELTTATTSSASDPNYSEESSTPVRPNNGRTVCPVGKRELPQP
jgi:hypothetical protein